MLQSWAQFNHSDMLSPIARPRIKNIALDQKDGTSLSRTQNAIKFGK
jgi:hypothetical protein